MILLPALFALMFLGMQAALYYHARTLATAAAEEGARAAAANGSTPAQGATAATAYLAGTGGSSVLEHTSATASGTTTSVTVTVHGSSLSVIPGWDLTVTQSATAPRERLTAP